MKKPHAALLSMHLVFIINKQILRIISHAKRFVFEVDTSALWLPLAPEESTFLCSIQYE